MQAIHLLPVVSLFQLALTRPHKYAVIEGVLIYLRKSNHISLMNITDNGYHFWYKMLCCSNQLWWLKIVLYTHEFKHNYWALFTWNKILKMSWACHDCLLHLLTPKPFVVIWDTHSKTITTYELRHYWPVGTGTLPQDVNGVLYLIA